MKKVLVLGGTGAMGVYLVPELLKKGYTVDVVSLDDRTSGDPCLRYIKTNAMDPENLERLLQNGYDGIVDFMIYRLPLFRERYRTFLEHTDHYIYLSSYRIYADEEHPIKETSPRLWDVTTDDALRASEDYCIYKAQGEDLLAASGADNWTVIRPAITYSQRRMQLTTLEANVHVARAAQGKTVLLPKDALEVQGTMSWAGDVARMIAGLLFNTRARGERFTVSTAEHHSWGEIAAIYGELIGLKYLPVSTDDFIAAVSDADWEIHARRQLIYDRLYDRIMDNSKILEYTGMKQSELMPLKEGLRRELASLPKGFVWPETPVNDRMDAYLAKLGK